MKRGAILASSVDLINEILLSKSKPKYQINNFFRKNKFAGAKDKNQIKELVFKFLKNYFSLQKISKDNLIKFSYRNGLLLYYFSKNKKITLEDIYEGKFSLTPKKEDNKIYRLAISLENEILPTFPFWLEEKLTFEFKKKKDENYKSILEEPRFDIRVNNNFIDRDKVIHLLAKNKILSKKTLVSPLGITIDKRILEKKIKSIKKNFFEVQDEGSQIVTILTGAKRGMKVLDYCAGKGTKTLALFNQMKGEGEIYVYDKSVNRLKFLKKRFQLMTNGHQVNVFNEKKELENYFDLVLLDVPCTGSGVWRRRPESLIRLDLNEYKKNLKIQSDLLNKVGKYCKRNGVISYITCSMFKDENENQIKKFLNNNKAFKILDINLLLNSNFNHINLNSIYKWLTLTPSYLKTDGFFICLLKKNV